MIDSLEQFELRFCILVFAVLDDLFKLNPEELNVGFTKPFISSALGHAQSHAKSMPISITAHTGNKFRAKTEIFGKRIDNRRPP